MGDENHFTFFLFMGFAIGIAFMGILAANSPRWHTNGEIEFCIENKEWCLIADPRLHDAISITSNKDQPND